LTTLLPIIGYQIDCRYDNWGKIIRIEELGLKTPLRIELDLPTDYDNPQVTLEPPPFQAAYGQHACWCSTGL
jgi:hypothetical protein